MTKSFYNLANFFLVLAILSGILNSVIHFLLGQDMYRLESSKNWHLLGGFVFLASSVFLLRYYYFKKFWLVFWTGCIAAIASVCITFVIYQLMSGKREFEQFYVQMLYFSLGMGLLGALSLVFSKSGKLPWLKTAGILSAILGIILLLTVIGFFNSQDLVLKADLEKINQWASWVSRLTPVFFVLHFRSEEEQLKNDTVANEANFLESWLRLACILSAGVTLFLAFNIVTQAYGLNNVSGRAKLLAQPFEARYYVSSKGDTLRYRFIKPLGYDPQKKYPLVICLHHGGTHGKDNIKQVEGSWAAYLSKEVNRKKYPAFLFAPQCPRDAGWGNYPGYPAIDTLIFGAIAALEKEFSMDTTRRYVLGVSGGGYASWHFIGTRPTMFAAAIPICGGGNPAFAHHIADAQVSVWAFHGEKDDAVPVSGSRDMIAAIRKAGGSPRYTEYKGAGHNIGYNVETTPGLLDWLFAQKRE